MMVPSNGVEFPILADSNIPRERPTKAQRGNLEVTSSNTLSCILSCIILLQVIAMFDLESRHFPMNINHISGISYGILLTNNMIPKNFGGSWYENRACLDMAVFSAAAKLVLPA